MPSFQDSALLVLLALILFGPKKLPELARQLGKLMAEFRRASNEFRMQMEEELRIADQEEQRKKIAAMEAAAPVAPAIAAETENTIAAPVAEASATEEFLVGHPHEQPQQGPTRTAAHRHLRRPQSHAPATGLPVSNSALSPVLDSIPHDPDPETLSADVASHEAAQRG